MPPTCFGRPGRDSILPGRGVSSHQGRPWWNAKAGQNGFRTCLGLHCQFLVDQDRTPFTPLLVSGPHSGPHPSIALGLIIYEGKPNHFLVIYCFLFVLQIESPNCLTLVLSESYYFPCVISTFSLKWRLQSSSQTRFANPITFLKA